MKGDGSEPEVDTDSDHEFHAKLWKTLVLLKFDHARFGAVYFVIEGLATVGENPVDHSRYYYEEHTCPINFIHGVPLIANGGDLDPHGLFEVVDAKWMPQRYVEATAKDDAQGFSPPSAVNDLLVEMFPALLA